MSSPTPRSPPGRPLMPLWLALVAATAGGWVMDLAYPSVGAWPLAFPAIALLLVALIGRRAWAALLVGLVYGAVFFLLLLSWTSRYLGPLPWAALTAVEASLTAIAVVPITLAYRWMPRAFPSTWARLVALPVLVAALWTGRELFLGSWPYGGFPWSRVGMTQSESPLANISSWLGVSGLSFLMVLLVALVIEVTRLRGWRPVRLIVPAAVTTLLLLTPAFPTVAAGSLRIGAVQGNGPTGYFDDRTSYAVAQAQSAATEQLDGQELDLLVWPEGSLDADPFQDAVIARRLSLLERQFNAPVLANTAIAREGRNYNTSMLWDGGGAEQMHAKRHPVPFGEYVPDRAFYNALAPDLIGLLQREYTPGIDPPLVTVDGVPVGLAICFDVIYDDVIIDGMRSGAQVLVFQTNNADFRGTDENLQQLAFARMRAIETGRSVVNVSTVGTSQVIRPDGSTQASLDADEAGALLEDVQLRSGLTGSVLAGPWVQQLLLWGGLAGAAFAWWRGRRRA